MFLRFLKDLFNPPSPWRGCHSPDAYDRMADYEIRLGKYKAEQWQKNKRIAQVFDQATAARVRPAFKPKLPSDNVVQIRRRK